MRNEQIFEQIMNKLITLLVILSISITIISCSDQNQIKDKSISSYQRESNGTRRLEWDDVNDVGWIKIMLEQANLSEAGVEVAEIYFPPGYQDVAHMHELELLYVLEGELDHIVNGVSHILKPGMLGVVKEPDLVVHRSHSDDGVKVLAIWPYGNEIRALDAEGLREIRLD